MNYKIFLSLKSFIIILNLYNTSARFNKNGERKRLERICRNIICAVTYIIQVYRSFPFYILLHFFHILSRISLFDPTSIFNLIPANQYYDSYRFLFFWYIPYISFMLSVDILRGTFWQSVHSCFNISTWNLRNII